MIQAVDPCLKGIRKQYLRLTLPLRWILTELVLVGFCLQAAPVPQPHPATQYVEGDAIVTFRPSISLDTAHQALNFHGLKFERHFAYLSQQRGQHCGLVKAANRTTLELIAELSADPAIEVAEPNYLRWTSRAIPNDPLFAQMWGLQNTGQAVSGTTGTAGADIRFVPATAMARSTTNPVVVAVVDTGVDYYHPDLAANMWVNPGEIANNGVDDDGNGFVDDYYGYDFASNLPNPTDSGFHGTHVAGTVAAVGNNMLGVIGVNGQAKIMALKVSSDGSSLTEAAIIEAVQYATMMKGRGANVVAINASFGGGGSNSTERAAIQAAGTAGIIFCAAAGNSNLNHDVVADYPSSYRLANMIVVAATDQNDALASFSDYGPTTVDLGAPGVNILSTEPTNMPSLVSSVRVGSTIYQANAITYSGTTTGLTASIIYCGIGYPSNFPPSVNHNIALIQRGTLYFSDKVNNATAAGARAVIIYNNVSGNFSGTVQTSGNWIPAISLSQSDGQALQASLPAIGTVVNAVDPTMVYQILSGTSMSTPHVAGAVSFAAMNYPTETVAQRIQRVLSAVDVVPGLQGMVRTGGRLNLLRIVDSDGNGLPDWWEQMYFGALTGTNPNADPDHDGASNLAEWLAGTNPTNAASALRLMPPLVTTSNSVILRWPSAAGKSYRLERATNLLTGFNSIVRSNILATPPLNSEPDNAALGGRTRYYRLRVEQ
jgi:subtilisin family serine protease